MKHDKLSEAMEHISDRHIAEATASRKRTPWIGAVAAGLALCILLGAVFAPGGNTQPQADPQDHLIQTTPVLRPTPMDPPFEPLQPVEQLSHKYALAVADYPLMSPYPTEYTNDTYTKWASDQRSMHNQPLGYADSLHSAWGQLLPALLKGETGKNTACSPVNLYMALAMLAETSGGESRQQILDLLGAENINALRTQANHIWRGHYNNDGLSKSIMGSSLWLDDDCKYNEATVKLLAENYHASVFQGDLATDTMSEALRSWLNEQTDGLLQQQAQELSFDPQTVLALATTLCYQVQWKNEFNDTLNTQQVFHSPQGDYMETFMHQELTYGPYYWGAGFGAVSLPLQDGSQMWLFLPDEGVSPQEIAGEVAQFLAQNPSAGNSGYENKKSVRVQLTVPKFDVSGDLNAVDMLKALGVTDVFDSVKADFTPMMPETKGAFVGSVSHAARVKIDEQGVTAAAYTVILECGAAMPPADEVVFTLDRPFMFCVESSAGVPLFAGIVNEP